MVQASTLRLSPQEGDVDEAFFARGLTDGLPVTTPTRTRVEKMLQGTSFGPLEIIGRCPPSYADVTVEKLAIAAVMAGCTPEMFRIVVAASRAILRPEFGLHGVHATTMGATPVVVVNGPCRHQAGINFRHAPCGSGSRSTSIGRALKLMLQNVGRAKLAGTESTTIGTPTKFGMCFAEWEERCALWKPLAFDLGIARRDEDAVTVVAATSGPVQMVDMDSKPKELIQRFGKMLASAAYAPQIPLVNNSLLVLSPEHYDTLVTAGFDSKAKVAEALWRASSRHMLPYFPFIFAILGKRRAPYLPAFIWRLLGALVAGAGFLLHAFGCQRLAMLVPKFSSPRSLQIAVAGSEAGKFSSFMPNFGVGRPPMPTAGMSSPTTELVEPRPAALDQPEPALAPERSEDILDPTSELSGTFLTLAKRSGHLAGPVALLDISKARGSEMLDVVERKLHAQGVETRRFTKPTFSRPCPETLRADVISECRGVVLGVAD